jgi:hypothetical protein
MIETVLLHSGKGGPTLFSPEWFRIDLLPFLLALLVFGSLGIVVCGVLYGYDRFRFDHEQQVTRAFAILWTAVYFVAIGITLGGMWDKAYHANRGFESFYSAPHLFVYGMVGLGLVLVIGLVRWYAHLFGPRLDRPIEIPGSLGLLVLGFLVTGVGGLVLDNAWHTAFGLDETPWSFPHMMISWGIVITMLGFAAATLALSRNRMASGRYRLLVAYILVLFSTTPIMGPFGKYHTVEQLQAVLSFSALEGSGLKDAFEVLETWQLVRTNPLAVVFGGVWAGAIVGFLRPYLDRLRAFAGLAVAFTLLRLSSNKRMAEGLDLGLSDPATWAPLPLLACAIVVLVGARLDWDERRTAVVAGAAFALAMALIWTPTVLGLAIATPVAILGYVFARRIGNEAYEIVVNPTERGLRRVATVAVAVPVTTGLVDLALRLLTGGIAG